jgi:hypothetical protein
VVRSDRIEPEDSEGDAKARRDARPLIKPWPAIVERYEQSSSDQGSMQAMLALTRYIAGSDISGRLHGWVSQFDLCIVDSEVTFPYLGPHLRVCPMPVNQIELRYINPQDKDAQWHLGSDLGDVVPNFIAALERLQWI